MNNDFIYHWVARQALPYVPERLHQPASDVISLHQTLIEADDDGRLDAKQRLLVARVHFGRLADELGPVRVTEPRNPHLACDVILTATLPEHSWRQLSWDLLRELVPPNERSLLEARYHMAVGPELSSQAV